MSLEQLQRNLAVLKERYPWISPERTAGTKVIHFWNQLAIALAVYFGYEITSELSSGSRKQAISNSLKEVRLEKSLHIFSEEKIQEFVVKHFVWLIKLSDLFYTVAHFAVPIIVLVVLFRNFPERYLVWRNVMAVMNVLALVIFVVFPVAPPKLLPAPYHFVNTQAVIGGAGSLDAVLMREVGNLYAAMPSLHFAWSIWCAWALAPVVKNSWIRRALLADPVVTAFVVVVTANHLWIDILGGLAVFVISGILFKAFAFETLEYEEVTVGSAEP